MDVWVEFKNASKWQAELLFRNFFPSMEEDNVVLEGELEGIDLPVPPSPSMESSPGSSALFSLPSSLSSPTDSSLSLPSLSTGSSSSSSSSKGKMPAKANPNDALRNQAYLPPPVEEEIAACKHSAAPLDNATLAELAKKFADSIPDEEFSVASLQGCESFLEYLPSLFLFCFISSIPTRTFIVWGTSDLKVELC